MSGVHFRGAAASRQTRRRTGVRCLAHSGARSALGSDFPVERPNPLLGFYAAVTRQDADGEPPGGWYPEQALSREEALRGFTLDAAYAAFMEDEVGSLAPGKWADFVVLSDDLMAVPAREILGITVLGGLLLWGVWRVRVAADFVKPSWWVYGYSLLYLALLFLAMALDRRLLA